MSRASRYYLSQEAYQCPACGRWWDQSARDGRPRSLTGELEQRPERGSKPNVCCPSGPLFTWDRSGRPAFTPRLGGVA